MHQVLLTASAAAFTVPAPLIGTQRPSGPFQAARHAGSALPRLRPLTSCRPALQMVAAAPQTLKNDLMLRVARGEKAEKTPVWLFRQAGRHLPERGAQRPGHMQARGTRTFSSAWRGVRGMSGCLEQGRGGGREGL